MSKLHLAVLQPNVPADSEPTQATGLYDARRTEFAWNDNGTAFRAVPLNWWDDASYADYQSRDCDSFDVDGHQHVTNLLPASHRRAPALPANVPAFIDPSEIPF